MKAMLWVLAGLLIGAVFALYAMKERAHWLASLEFELSAPPVPFAVLEKIQTAERHSYSERSILRQAVEELQDVLVFAWPALAYRADFSVGRYRIKARTIEAILPWAIESGFLTLDGVASTDFAHAIAYFSEQPVLNDWQAAILLEWLRQDHPGLADIEWPAIASDPALVAKLYSGYMGAGGDWDGWRANLSPGPIAMKRMGLTGDLAE